MLIDETLYTPLNTCPLCGNKESELIRVENNKFPVNNEKDRQIFSKYQKDPIHLLMCKNCHFCYVDKLPKDPLFYKALYNQIQYDYEYEHTYHGKKEIDKDIKRQLNRYCPSGRLLDIGTWCGTLLSFLKSDYSVVGCEISQSAANYALSLGLDVKVGSFDSVSFDSESFDIITIIDVLEHLPQPRSVLEKIYGLLKPDGIVYIKVPNIQAQINKQSFLNALNLSTAGVCENYIHINHFSHESLTSVLASLGFEVMEIGYTKAEIWDLSFPETYNLKIKKWSINQIRNLVTTVTNFLSRISKLDVGFNIYIIARKPK
jgi:2-polyprenyl-3-methyl-5-hydroxy-6-metoxy-1,4-benzoquinol methylase